MGSSASLESAHARLGREKDPLEIVLGPQQVAEAPAKPPLLDLSGDPPVAAVERPFQPASRPRSTVRGSNHHSSSATSKPQRELGIGVRPAHARGRAPEAFAASASIRRRPQAT